MELNSYHAKATSQFYFEAPKLLLTQEDPRNVFKQVLASLVVCLEKITRVLKMAVKPRHSLIPFEKIHCHQKQQQQQQQIKTRCKQMFRHISVLCFFPIFLIGATKKKTFLKEQFRCNYHYYIHVFLFLKCTRFIEIE